jgi:hypothetical protein
MMPLKKVIQKFTKGQIKGQVKKAGANSTGSSVFLEFISSKTLECGDENKIDTFTIIEQVARKLICCSLFKMNEYNILEKLL